jgi:hypothetical protein
VVGTGTTTKKEQLGLKGVQYQLKGVLYLNGGIEWNGEFKKIYKVSQFVVKARLE